MTRLALSRVRHHLTEATALATITLLTAAPAHASGSSMPWEEPLQKILESIEGPVAKIVAVIIIITTGLTLAFGDTAGGFRRLVQIVFGLSIAFAEHTLKPWLRHVKGAAQIVNFNKRTHAAFSLRFSS